MYVAGAFLSEIVTAKTPVIIDTDVGSDFDDSVAIMLALQNEDLDVKLIVTATNDTDARARIVAKYLVATNNTHVPIGLGVPGLDCRTSLFGWGEDMDLKKYQSDHGGVVHYDGIQAMHDVIIASSEPVAIIAIAPATNFPSLLQRFPQVVHNANIRAMSGSIYRGYGNSSQPAAEYNVAKCASCSQKMYTAGWMVTITPLDTCGVAFMGETSFDILLNGLGPYSTILIESWVHWCSRSPGACHLTPLTSDVFYDAVAVTLATSSANKYLVIEERKVKVTDDGHTVVSSDGTSIQAALQWQDGGTGLNAFLDWLATEISRNPSALNP